MDKQDELLKDIIININKTNKELNRVKIIIKDNKRQIKNKNIIIIILLIVLFCESIFSTYLYINRNKNNEITKMEYKGNTIVTNNKLDNDSQININKKNKKKEAYQ